MKTLMFSASAAAFTLLMAGSVPAAAQSNAQTPSLNKCVWQPAAQSGPRAPLRAPVCTGSGDQREEWTGQGGPECDPGYTGTTGHYVWRARPQSSPRAPVQAPVRVWVEAC
jgi:hypothetical protein